MKRNIRMWIAIVMCIVIVGVIPGTPVQAAQTIYNNDTGTNGGYNYELWKDNGTTSMTLNDGGTFSCQWSNIGNALFRKGLKFNSDKTYQQLGNISVDYGCQYNPSGNSYLCIYGWTRSPLVEYYIVDSWGSWRPPGATSKGTITVDGGTYDVYETTRVNQPSIDGNTTFQQYWSVRTSKRTSGTISVSEHFKQWENKGMRMGKMYEVALTVEGYQSSGNANVYQNDIKVGGSGNTTPTPTSVPSSRNAYSNIQAESYDSSYGSNLKTFSLSNGGSAIGYLENGYSTTYKNVDFSNGLASVTARVATQNSTSIQVRSGSATGTLLGTISVPSTSGWDSYQNVTANLSGVTGVRDITLVYSGAVNVDYFAFKAATQPTATPTPTATATPTPKPTATSTPQPTPTTVPNAKSAFSNIQAESYDSSYGTNLKTFSLSDGGSAIGYLENGYSTTYKNIDFGNGAASITARVAAQNATSIQVRSGSASGTLLGTISVGSTGSWDTYSNVSANISKTTGVKDIVLVYSGGVNVDYFKFNTKAVSDTQSATLLNTYGSLFGNMGTCINYSQLQDSNTLNVVKQQYNSITLENEMKPDAILGSSPSLISVSEARNLGYYIPSNWQDSMVPRLNFSTVDKVMQICSQNGLRMRAHTLVWHSQTPGWFFRSGFNGGSGFVSTQVMDAREEFYVKSMINHVYNNQYGNVVYAWDVVNEHLHASNSGWAGVYGNAKNASFVRNGFKYANDALVTLGKRNSVKLFYNDYNTYEVTNDIVSLVKYINQNGKYCDGVGMQAHLDTSFPSASSFKSTIQTFLNNGFEVQITEFDATNNNASTQASYCYDIFKGILDCKKAGGNITGITIWGLYDSISWRSSQSPLLFSGLTQPKQSYNSVLKAYTDSGYSIGDTDIPGGDDPVTPTPTPSVTPTPTATPTPVPDTQSAYSNIQAEKYDSSYGSNLQTFNLSNGGSAIGYLENGYSTTYKNVDFGDGAVSVTARVATQNSTSIQVRSGSASGTLLGTISVSSTGGWDTYSNVTTNISKTTGVKDIVLVFSGAVNVDSFIFLKSGSSTTPDYTGKKLVALTFDDGPNTTTTPQILDILEREGVVASFFLIGNNINDNVKSVMQRQISLGCELNNHSWSHSDMKSMSYSQAQQEIANTNNKIYQMVGVTPKFFRPPYISTSNGMYQAIDLPFICGMTCNDWENSTSASQRSSTVLNNVKDGDIILLHDFSGNSNTVQALSTIIQGLKDRGYAFVTVSKLFELKGMNPNVEYKMWNGAN